MKIVIAPNAFKESLSAWEAARALQTGLRRALPAAELILAPVADGGDGTVEALVRVTGGRMRRTRVDDPLGRPIRAAYGVLGDGKAAVIEMAAASGLRLLAPNERDPMRASTHGTGQLIRAAVERGSRRCILGVGGSATTDGGAGMAHALGYRFLDVRGREFRPRSGNLSRIAAIDPAPYLRWLDRMRRPGGAPSFTLACDVNNPMVGPRGAARVYAPQKGASPRQVERLEAGMAHFAGVIRRDLGVRVKRLPGGGAGGGLGAGLVAFCGAAIRPGAETIIEAIGFEEFLKGADWVITGEGRLDRQTLFGKAPAVVASLARRRGIPVIGVAGALGPGSRALLRRHFDALFSIADGPASLEDTMRRTPSLLTSLGEAIGGVIRGS
ncbi:MAG TPA: glycerate kinase [Sumerlaeia bacterium]|nr:glycerate kinase [Sumerlaeia bacterium]